MQEEAEDVLKRAQFAERAFLDLYRQLMDAPDPAAMTGSDQEAAAQLHDAREEIRRLKQELEVHGSGGRGGRAHMGEACTGVWGWSEKGCGVRDLMICLVMSGVPWDARLCIRMFLRKWAPVPCC